MDDDLAPKVQKDNKGSSARVTWDKATQGKFEIILKEIPALIRGIAETRVSKKAENIVKEDSRLIIEEKDMVAAFFAETPPGFVGAMKESMETLKINYAQYGYE